MASNDYIPRSEAERIAWLKHFDAWMAAHGASKGFTPAELTALNTDVTEADSAYEDSGVKEAAYRAGIQLKQHSIADATGLSRDYVKRLQANPTMTDAERADAGITVPDTTPTPADPDAIEQHDPPDCVLEFDKRLRVTIHFGLNPHDESHNARPAGTFGALIQYHRGGIPEHEDDWATLDIDTRSPYVHIVHEDTPTTYAYRACWVDKKAKKGPYGDPAVCTVSV